MASELTISNVKSISRTEFEKPDAFGQIESYGTISQKEFEKVIEFEEMEFDDIG